MGGFLVNALKGWFDKKSKDKAERAEYDSRYTNNPRWQLRNQLLTQLWNEHNLADRFKDAFPDPNDPQYAGRSVKTPENVLIGLTTPPRYGGRPGTGFDFAGLLLGQAQQAAASAAAAGGGGMSDRASAAATGFLTSGTGEGLDAPIVPPDWDPFRFRRT